MCWMSEVKPVRWGLQSSMMGARMTHQIRQKLLGGERALFGACDLSIADTVFTDGESPLKQSQNIDLDGCSFYWKYPLWYSKHVKARGCTWFEMARSGVWYTDDVCVEDTVFQAPKNFRRCAGVVLRDVTMTNAAETLWTCRDVRLERVTAKGDYFGMNCEDVEVDGLILDGNYCFDGARRVHIKNSRLLSKDAFWNTEDVLIEDSFIAGEYLGWNSRNMRLERCCVQSSQGMCYIDGLVMRDCKLVDTTLAFEYSRMQAEVSGRIDSVFNPAGGSIEADAIGTLILDADRVDPAQTSVVARCGGVPAPVSSLEAGAQGPCDVRHVVGQG